MHFLSGRTSSSKFPQLIFFQANFRIYSCGNNSQLLQLSGTENQYGVGKKLALRPNIKHIKFAKREYFYNLILRHGSIVRSNT